MSATNGASRIGGTPPLHRRCVVAVDIDRVRLAGLYTARALAIVGQTHTSPTPRWIPDRWGIARLLRRQSFVLLLTTLGVHRTLDHDEACLVDIHLLVHDAKADGRRCRQRLHRCRS